MYRESNFWQWLGAFSLGLIAAINNAAYLSEIATGVLNWVIKTNLLQMFTGYLNTFIHLLEFTFNNFTPFIIALLVWWFICKR